MKIEKKLWPQKGEKGFKEFWPSDIASDPTCSIFKLDQDIIK